MQNITRLPETVCSSLSSSVYLFDLTRIVEELVLNSLDAGSTKVCVFINVEGCCAKVEDNGCGITREELALLGEKYVETTEVHHVSACDADTEGFHYRREILGSLSDISVLEVITKAHGMPNGYHKILKGRKCLFLGIDDYRRAVGTTVIVRDLFYNQAVRRKNMQSSPKKVLYSVKKCVLHSALVHPQVSFTVVDVENDTEILSTFPSKTPLPLVSSYFGSEVSNSLVEINVSHGDFQLSGYLSQPTSIFFAKTLQHIYINFRFIGKGPMHKLIESLATDHQNSSNICSGVSEFQSTKRHKVQGHAAYILKLSCPSSIYDLSIEPSKTAAEFKDWDPILSFIKHAIISFWKPTTGHISQESNINENDPSNRDVKRDLCTAVTPEKNMVPKMNLQSDWNFIPESPHNYPLKKQIKISDSFEILDSLEVLKSRTKYIKPHHHMAFYNHQVDCFSEDMIYATLDISCSVEQDTNFQSNPLYKSEKLDNDFSRDDVLQTYHGFSSPDQDDCSFSTLEDTTVNEIIKHNIFDNENSMKISFLTNNSCSPSGRKQELLDNIDGSLLISDENLSNDMKSENHFYLGCIDDTDTAHVSKSFCSIDHRVCKDEVARYHQSPFVMKKCRNKAESDFLENDHTKADYEEEGYFTKENKTRDTSWAFDLTGDIGSPFIESDWCFESPFSSGNIPRITEHSHRYAFETNYATYGTSYSKHFYASDSEDSPAYFNGQSRDILIHNKGCKMTLDSPYKTTVNKYPSDRGKAELNMHWLYGHSDEEFASINSSANDYAYDPLLDNFPQKLSTTSTRWSRSRSKRSHSAPPFSKCKRRYFVACNCPDSKSNEDRVTPQNDNSSHGTGIAIDELSNPCSLSQPHMEQGLGEHSLTCNRCIEVPRLQVSDNDKIDEKFIASDGSVTKWRSGDLELTCIETPEKNSCKKDDILDISSGLLRLAGSFLVPESINRDVLEDAKVLLQLDKKFIPIVASGNLAVIDQHAADERIRLEELRRKVLSGEHKKIIYLESEQELVLPEMGFQLLQNYAEHIRIWGWICNIHDQCSESFSENLNILKRISSDVTLVAVPCILGITLTSNDLVEFLEQLAETDGSATTPPSVNRVLNLKACRGAIMFGDSLLPSECSLIIEELKSTSLCFQCAHGRPTTAPLVNLFELHKQLDKLTQQNWNQTRDWHGIFRHEPTYERARQRLGSVKTLQAVSD